MKPLPTPSLQLEFSDLNGLLKTWARHVAEGRLFLPFPAPKPQPEYHLKFVVGGKVFSGQRARVVPPERAAPTPAATPGFWVEIEPGQALVDLVELHARKLRQGRPINPPPGAPRVATRFATVLDVGFENLPQLAAQYASDISRGGLFIRCATQPPMRSRVQLRLTLPNQETLLVDAEVVHCTSTGVGVQFLDKAQLGPIGQLLETFQQRRPKVLVVDDEAIWRSTLARALTQLGVDVQLAADGKEGLIKLIDGFFELDLAIIDLHMPNLDGRGLIERIRRNGGENGLKLFLFSAASREELEALGEPGFATAVFSKLDSFDQLIARIAYELPAVGNLAAANAPIHHAA